MAKIWKAMKSTLWNKSDFMNYFQNFSCIEFVIFKFDSTSYMHWPHCAAASIHMPTNSKNFYFLLSLDTTSSSSSFGPFVISVWHLNFHDRKDGFPKKTSKLQCGAFARRPKVAFLRRHSAVEVEIFVLINDKILV